MRDIFRAILLSLTLLIPFGCATLPKPSLDQKRRGMTFILPGIEGRSPLNADIAKGLIAGGVDSAIVIHDWTTKAGAFGWFVHLTNERRNRVESVRFARAIRKYQREFPDRPVNIIAHSGGAGLALLAVERLPAKARLDNVILLAGAVSPDRDLTPSLAHIDSALWNFYSPHDVFFLKAGTRLFGTIDRKNTEAAGAVGFNFPENPNTPNHAEARATYDTRLRQIPWHPDMKSDDHHGGHDGWARKKWVARWLAPIILHRRPFPNVTYPDLSNYEAKP